MSTLSESSAQCIHSNYSLYRPSWTGVDVDDETLLTLAEEKTIIGIKDAGGDISRIKRLKQKLPSDFLYLGGNDDEIIENIEMAGPDYLSK